MSKVQLNEVENGIWVSDCGRMFKEFKYDIKGAKCRPYKYVTINKKRIGVHRYIAEKFIPNPENKPWVLHNNDDQNDNSISNLRWGTPKENAFDIVLNNIQRAKEGKALKRPGRKKINKNYSEINNLLKQKFDSLGFGLSLKDKRKTIRRAISNEINLFIRESINSGVRQIDIANILGVSQGAVSIRIKNMLLKQ